MRFSGFIGPTYKLNSIDVDCQRCINLYPEKNETGFGKAGEVMSLVHTPGLRLLTTLGVGPVRGSWYASNGRFFVVSGNKLYELDSSFSQTEVGTLSTHEGPVSMADNGLQLAIVDGFGYGFTFADNTFAQITDEDFPGANQVTYQDGYFIFNEPDTGNFFISDLDSLTFLNEFDEADVFPDNLVGLISDHRDLWLFGTMSTEIWFNSGNANFPFERTQGAFIEHGLGARFSIAKMNNTVYWLGSDDKGSGIVLQAQGYQPQRISTHAVEQAIQGYADISDANAYTYQQDGHYFYVLNFPSANTTWVYDAATTLWHERVFTNQGAFERHRADNHSFAFGRHVVGDYATGKLYELSRSTYSDNGSEISRQRISPHITGDMKRIFYSSFQLDIESGTGLDGTGQGTDPQAMLQYSDDGGHSWSNEKWVSLGKIGQTRKRAKWNRLGLARDRVFKITVTDPVKVTFIGAEIEFEKAAS